MLLFTSSKLIISSPSQLSQHPCLGLSFVNSIKVLFICGFMVFLFQPFIFFSSNPKQKQKENMFFSEVYVKLLNPLMFSSKGNHFLLAPRSRTTNIVCFFLGNSFNLLWGLTFEHNYSATLVVSFNLAISILHLIEPQSCYDQDRFL